MPNRTNESETTFESLSRFSSRLRADLRDINPASLHFSSRDSDPGSSEDRDRVSVRSCKESRGEPSLVAQRKRESVASTMALREMKSGVTRSRVKAFGAIVP